VKKDGGHVRVAPKNRFDRRETASALHVQPPGKGGHAAKPKNHMGLVTHIWRLRKEGKGWGRSQTPPVFITQNRIVSVEKSGGVLRLHRISVFF